MEGTWTPRLLFDSVSSETLDYVGKCVACASA
jgi:hypothetical protein